MQTSDYVTIAAGHFLQPLAAMLEKLLERERVGIPGVQANNIEVDWSVSAILLATTMFESWLGWVRLKQGQVEPKPVIASSYYSDLRVSYGALPDLRELFAVRNAVVHNHIWNVEFEWGEANEGMPVMLRHVDGGNQDFRNVVDFDAGVTLVHRIHVVANLMDRVDVSKVLTIIVGAMEQLVALDLLLPQSLQHRAIFGADGGRMNLAQIAAYLRQRVGVE